MQNIYIFNITTGSVTSGLRIITHLSTFIHVQLQFSKPFTFSCNKLSHFTICYIVCVKIESYFWLETLPSSPCFPQGPFLSFSRLEVLALLRCLSFTLSPFIFMFIFLFAYRRSPPFWCRGGKEFNTGLQPGVSTVTPHLFSFRPPETQNSEFKWPLLTPVQQIKGNLCTIHT
jgi:hypothetical protein